MKKLTFFFSLLISSASFAQDWAPFKASDNIRNYISDTTTSFQGQEHLIQAVQVDTSFISNGKEVKVLKKGLSFLKHSFSSQFAYHQVIRGQLFGDTIVVGIDSSTFLPISYTTASPHFSFKLIFPHHFYNNQIWQLGFSDSLQIFATVDSMYTTNLSNFGADSIVSIKLTVRDSSNATIFNHPYHRANLKIAKHNGLIEGIDFTTQLHLLKYRFYSSESITVNTEELFQLNVGDEYHYILADMFNLLNDGYSLRVIQIDTVNNKKQVSFQRKYRKNYYSTTFPLTIDTTVQSFPLNQTYFTLQSQIVEDSLIVFGNYQRRNINYFLIDSSNALFPLRIRNYDHTFIFLPFLNSIPLAEISNNGLSFFNDLYIIGLDQFYSYYYTGSIGPVAPNKGLAYVKKGNQTWGTPINSLLVDLDNLSSEKENVSFYPNPVTNQLFLTQEKQWTAISITDLKGKTIRRFKNQQQIDVSDLVSGIYFLRLSNSKEIITKKFIKN